jgi:hypothetical protein
MKTEQDKPIYYDGSGTILFPQQASNAKDIIVKPVGVTIAHVQFPYFPYQF